RFGRETIQGRYEKMGCTRLRQLMTLHEILREEEIANRREDRGEQDAHRLFTLVEQSLNQPEGMLEITHSKRIAQLEDDSGTRDRHNDIDILRGAPPLFLPEEQIELLELAVDRAAVAAREEDEEIAALLVETQPVFPA